MIKYWGERRPFTTMRGWFGIEKPLALQWGEWDDWHTKTKAEHPFGFWLTETVPHFLNRFDRIFSPYRNVMYYIRNRWHRQTHVLPTDFTPGTYHDLRERILHACMQSIVDFVEVEKAWMTHIFDNEGKKWKLDWRGRNAEAGLEHLKWEAGLDDPSLSETERGGDNQAHAAREVMVIYDWWKNIRPARPDPHEASGWDAFYDEQNKKRNGVSILDERLPRDPEDDVISATAMKKLHEIEMAYDAEDEEMLIRLMKIRLNLWT